MRCLRVNQRVMGATLYGGAQVVQTASLTAHALASPPRPPIMHPRKVEKAAVLTEKYISLGNISSVITCRSYHERGGIGDMNAVLSRVYVRNKI
jgi:hypothetical protein